MNAYVNQSTQSAPDLQADPAIEAAKQLDEYHSAVFYYAVGAFPGQSRGRIDRSRAALEKTLRGQLALIHMLERVEAYFATGTEGDLIALHQAAKAARKVVTP